VNQLTGNDPAVGEPLIGTWTYNGIPVTVEAAPCPAEFE
jgi:hypothetical protein